MVGALVAQKLLTPVDYTPPETPTFTMPTATTFMIVNQIPLGCVPAMLTQYGGNKAKYDNYGCLSDLNEITAAHNKLLGEKVAALRTKYPKAKLVYADAESVYWDILKSPKTYSKSTAPIRGLIDH